MPSKPVVFGTVLRWAGRGPLLAMYICPAGGKWWKGIDLTRKPGYVTDFYGVDEWKVEELGPMTRDQIKAHLASMTANEIRELFERMTAGKGTP